MVRAFLTKIGEEYLGHSFNTGSGKGKEIWTRIKEKTFNKKCAFCGSLSENLTMEHLIMFNRDQCRYIIRVILFLAVNRVTNASAI